MTVKAVNRRQAIIQGVKGSGCVHTVYLGGNTRKYQIWDGIVSEKARTRDRWGL